MRPTVIELEGSNYQMGYQYGRKYGPIIKESVSTNYQITRFYTGLSREDCLRSVGRFIPHLEESVPHLCDEMKGISDGSGIRYEDILVLNFHSRDLPRGCSMLFLGKRATRDGRALTGQTVDWTPMLRGYYHVLRLFPDSGPEIVQFTQAGVIGLVGKNRHGLSVFMNILLTSDTIEIGVPAYLLLRLAMEQKNLKEAIALLRTKKRSSPFNYLISDSSGKACNIEATPKNFLPDRISKSFYVHTNHCLQTRLKPKDMYVKITGSDETKKRLSRMTRMLRSTARKKIALGDVFNFLADHENYPDSICRHGRDRVAEAGRMGTIGAVVSRESEPGLWLIYGNPCANGAEFFPLTESK